MNSIEFIKSYNDYLQIIKQVTKKEYLPVLEKMEKWDPHDLVTPETWFADENSAWGYIYRLFINEIKNAEKDKEHHRH